MWSVIRLLDEGRVDVDAALELPGAGPAAGALVLAQADGTRARDAPDRRVAAVVQRVVRDLVHVDIGVDPLRIPVHERLHLPDAVALRPLELLRGRPRRRLLAPDAGDPRVVAAQRPLQRLDLAGSAAAVGIRLPQPVRGVDRP